MGKKASRTTGITPHTVDRYIAAFPAGVREMLQQVRDTIRRAAPGSEETIKYGIPTYVLRGNLVHFGAFQHHIGFYPTPSGIEAFRRELEGYQVARGSVRFPMDDPLPLDLIERIVRFRVEETRVGTPMGNGQA